MTVAQRLTFLITSYYLLITGIAFAATYPSSCPAAAQAIVEAVGGCSSVNRSSFPAVYEKCCVQVAPTPILIPTPTLTPTPALTPTSPTSPKTIPPPSKTPPPAVKKPFLPYIPPPKPIKYTEPFRDLPYLATSTQVTEQVSSSEFKVRLAEIIKEKLWPKLNRIFRLFRSR